MRTSGVDLESLSEHDVVFWDFDCTLTRTHYYKTMYMDKYPQWKRKWGGKLSKWWETPRGDGDGSDGGGSDRGGGDRGGGGGGGGDGDGDTVGDGGGGDDGDGKWELMKPFQASERLEMPKLLEIEMPMCIYDQI